jgi:hypothetical protein
MVRPCRDLDGPCTVLQVYYLLDRVQLAVELVARFVHGAEPAFPEPPHLPGPVPCLLDQRRGALAIAGDWLARRVLARPAARREVGLWRAAVRPCTLPVGMHPTCMDAERNVQRPLPGGNAQPTDSATCDVRQQDLLEIRLIPRRQLVGGAQ